MHGARVQNGVLSALPGMLELADAQLAPPAAHVPTGKSLTIR